MMFSLFAKLRERLLPGKKFLLVKPGYDFFPIGLSYVASTMERASIPYDFVEIAKSAKALGRIMCGEGYFAIGIGGLVSDFCEVTALSREAKRAAPQVPCILGGLMTQGVDRNLLLHESGADFAVLGEAERTLPELLHAILAGQTDFSAIKGLLYRATDGSVCATPPRPRIDPAVGGIFPSFDFTEAVFAKGQPLPVLTGRGCSGACTFCMPMHRSFRPRSFDDVFIEIETLSKRCQASSVAFLSEIVFSKDEDIIRFFREYRKRVSLPFRCLLRLDADIKVLQPLKDAGCFEIGIGAESGSDAILRIMGKGITTEQTRAFVKEADRLGLRHDILTNWMVNNETETRADIGQTLVLHEELNIRSGLSYTIPYPGTVIYKNAKRKGLIDDELEWLNTIEKLNYADFLTDVLFQYNSVGKPLFPNISAMPYAEWYDALLHAASVMFNYYTLQSKRISAVDGKTCIHGTCPICGLESSFEINLLSPIVRNLTCPNAVRAEGRKPVCHNDARMTAHVFTIPAVARHAAEVDAAIKKTPGRIGIVGDPFIFRFLVCHGIFSFTYRDKVAGVSTRSGERIGQYAFSIKGLAGPENTRLLPLQSLVDMEPDCILAAEMPPGSLSIRNELETLGYAASKVLLMTPEILLESEDCPNKQAMG